MEPNSLTLCRHVLLRSIAKLHRCLKEAALQIFCDIMRKRRGTVDAGSTSESNGGGKDHRKEKHSHSSHFEMKTMVVMNGLFGGDADDDGVGKCVLQMLVLRIGQGVTAALVHSFYSCSGLPRLEHQSLMVRRDPAIMDCKNALRVKGFLNT